MPKLADELTPAQIRMLRHPGGDRPIKVAVGGIAGLHIQIQPSGAKSWVLRGRYGQWQETVNSDGRIARGRKKREIGLGSYPEVLPGTARDRAREAKSKLDLGIDPVAERREARSALTAAARNRRTFGAAFEEFSAAKEREFSTDRYREQWKSIARRHALPLLGEMPVQEVKLSDILDVLKPLWETKTATATKLRQILEGTLAFATVSGWRSGGNPALWKGNLSFVLGSPSKIGNEQNYPAIRLDDARRWWRDLKEREGMGAEALRFQATTATRTGAVRYATWQEFDLDRGVWTIAPERTASKIPKKDKAKRVVLTEKSVVFLEGLPRRHGSKYVFWSPRGGPLSDATIGRVMRTLHELDMKKGGTGFTDEYSEFPAVPHGLRSTFRTWVSERTEFELGYGRNCLISQSRHEGSAGV